MKFSRQKLTSISVAKWANHLREEAESLAKTLKRRQACLVLAESCTCGQASAALGTIPGISQFFCGSMVVYQDLSKTQWLGITPCILRQHTSVSAEVTRALAENILKNTSVAHFAASVTGHLGPFSPRAPKSDRRREGLVFIAIALRMADARKLIRSIVLPLKLWPDAPPSRILRRKRQLAASQALLFMVRSVLNFQEDSDPLKRRRFYNASNHTLKH